MKAQNQDSQTTQTLRRAHRADCEIMTARTLARGRGATPAQIERNVIALKVGAAVRGHNGGIQVGTARDWNRGVIDRGIFE